MRVRALGLVILLVLPLALAAEAPTTHDLIILLAPDGHAATEVLRLAPQARATTILPAFVVLDAPPALEAKLRALPGVERVDRASALEFHTHEFSLRLTRADATPSGLGDLRESGRGITVAVVDSGIDATHPDLSGRVKANTHLLEGQFADAPGDTTGHGTHVAGIVAASGVSGGHAGVAPAAELVGVDITNRFTTASALLAYDWLFAHRESLGVNVVVNAWGRTDRTAFDPGDTVVRAIDRLVDQGVVVLFSASNHGPGPSTLSLESQNPRVITVGASDDAGLPQAYSSRGPALGGAARVKPDVVAPGEGIISLRSTTSTFNPDTDVDALHRELSGTSQSVPHVAGIVALMLEARPGMTPLEVQNALRDSAIDLGPEGPDDITGFGLVDARDAIRRARTLAPDRENILITGGIDRYESTARSLVAPTTFLGFLRRDIDVWTTTFPVKPSAESLTLDLSWQGSVTPLTATVTDGSGRTAGAWTGTSRVTGALDNPAPGVWTLTLSGAPSVPLELTSAVEVTLPPNATRAMPLDPEYLDTAPAAGKVWVAAVRAAVLEKPWVLLLTAAAVLAGCATMFSRWDPQ